MISEADYHGGARRVTNSFTLNSSSPRVTHAINNTGALINIDLPEFEENVPKYRDHHVGGPVYIIINDATSTGNYRIREQSGAFTKYNLATVAPGSAIRLYIRKVSGKYRFVHTTCVMNVAGTLGYGTFSGTLPTIDPPVYSPNCFDGDPCLFARLNGSVPLDGEHEFPVGSGNEPEVLIPMFEDIINAKNSSREPIRAADIVMPSVIAVWFREGEFTIDPEHPEAPSELSPEFYEWLYNGLHALSYDSNGGSGWGTTTRHWHHIRYKGTSWSLGTDSIQRLVWREVASYGPPEDPNRYTAEIRVVCEHTCATHPSIDPVTNPGSTSDPDDFIWGTAANLYVFTNEVKTSFVDGGTYQPAGGTASVAFTKNDPAVWGNASGVSGGNDDDKFCHPQMVICGSLPTTFQRPLGSNYVPLLEREYASSGVAGKNLEHCYKVGNFAPWSGTTCNTGTNSISLTAGGRGNIIFGKTIGGNNFAAMTVGGGMDKSELFEFVVLENGNGVGRTVLRPKRAGWDEDCGRLALEQGSSVGIRICTETGTDEDWPAYTLSPCRGHPDEPIMGHGGSHTAFNNAASDDFDGDCCFDLNAQAAAMVVDKCTDTITEYGDWDGIDECELDGQECKEIWTRSKSVALDLEDYGYTLGATLPGLPTITYTRYEPDDEAERHDFDGESEAFTDWSSEIGTWSVGDAAWLPTAINTGKNVSALSLFKPSSYTFDDTVIQARSVSISNHTTALATRVTVASGNMSGYLGVIDSRVEGEEEFAIYRVDNDVLTKLISFDLSTQGLTAAHFNNVFMKMSSNGSTHQFTVDIGIDTTPAAFTRSLTVEDCTYLEGNPGLATINDDDFLFLPIFPTSTIDVFDNRRVYHEITITTDKDGHSSSFPIELHPIYNKCNRTYPDGCPSGEPPIFCNCINHHETPALSVGASFSGPPDYTTVDYDLEVAGSNPTYPGAPCPSLCVRIPCGDGSPSCNDCPAPFEAIAFYLPYIESDPDTPLFCRGIAGWLFQEAVCA